MLACKYENTVKYSVYKGYSIHYYQMDVIPSWGTTLRIASLYIIKYPHDNFIDSYAPLMSVLKIPNLIPSVRDAQETAAFNFIHSLLPVHHSSSLAKPLYCILNLISHEVFSKVRPNLASDRLYNLEHKPTFPLCISSEWLAHADLHQYAVKGPTLPSNANIPTLYYGTVCLPLAFNFFNKMVMRHVLILWLYNCLRMWLAISWLWFFS